MTKPDLLKAEAKRLYQLGFAIHWLHPESKRPIENKWTTGPRHTWDYLNETYFTGLNVGVRLGTPSKIGDRYLGVIDVDVKSTDPEDAKAARDYVKGMIKALTGPKVESGRGGGSMHIYFVSDVAQEPALVKRSDKIVKAFMPSKAANRKNTEGLTEREIKQGYRLAAAWEVSLMGNGQQVVLPPSIHPDSKKNYRWVNHLNKKKDLPVLDFSQLVPDEKPKSDKSGQVKQTAGKVEKFSFEQKDVNLFDVEISEKIFTWITTGEGVEDRSASLLPICKALIKAGLDQNEILSVLVDPNNWISSCGYEHTQSRNPARAAYWVYKYSLRKVLAESAPGALFTEDFDLGSDLTEDEIEAEQDEFEATQHWTQGLDCTDKGNYRNTFKNAKLMIDNALEHETFYADTPPLLGHNEFAGNDYFIEDTPWGNKAGEAVSDTSILNIKDWCIQDRGIEFSVNVLNEVVQQISYANRFHPVREYIKGLEWDGVKRVDTWVKDFAGGKAPEPYLSDISRKFLVAMVKRVFEPGCQYRQVLILEGPQEAGKSSIARALGGEWFTDAPLNIGDKDSIMAMQSNWIIELGELSALNKSDALVLKAFISQQTDRMRPPYGRRMVDYPRQSVFIGTTNDEHYLKDPTGNTRFWPVKVGDAIDFEGCREVRDQLFAEAYELYKAGESLWLDNPKSKQQAADQQREREQQDEWLPYIRDVVTSDTWLRGEFEIKDLAKNLTEIGAHKMGHYDVFRVTTCLKKLGFTSFRESGGKRRRLWRSPELSEKAEPTFNEPNFDDFIFDHEVENATGARKNFLKRQQDRQRAGGVK